MSQVIGIDLGTTNSCVAVPESAVEESRRDRLVAERRLRRVAGALILTDRVKAATVPSAVWVEADGTVVTGRTAKQRAGRGQGRPALFFKREMGTTGTVPAGSRQLPAEEASAQMLRHLRHMAEELLEDEVGRAVITVPAFFTLNARQATKRAGERAGLEVLDVLLEPVAAALAYTNTVVLEQPRKFMVYDLGGGTFDVSLVTWDPEVDFQMRSFHGDPLLGGYDFDREIANWLVRQLGDDYDLTLDHDDPGDAAIFSRLMALAEVAKHDLSRPGESGLEVEIVDTTLTDRAGTPMEIRLSLTRDEFEQMIDKHVQGTLSSCALALAACDRVLEETGIGAMELSDVIMVGGSSRIPLIADRLRERFGVEPRLLDPDLCVAAGAALKVDSLGSFGRYLKLDPLPARTSEPSIDVGGRVLGEPTAAASLVLAAGHGPRWQSTAGGGGEFSFQDVPLRAGPNQFTISLLREGEELERHEFAVEGTADANGDEAPRTTVPDVLPHDISIAVVQGFEVVAASGTRLPTRVTANFRLARRTDTVAIELYEGNSRIGEVAVRDLAPTVPLGSPVLVDLAFSGNSTVDVAARIPAGGDGAVGEATIEIPKVAVLGWDDLRAAYQDAIVAWNSLHTAVEADDLLEIGPRIDGLLAEVGDLLNQRQNRRRTHHLVLEVETLLRKLHLAEPELRPSPAEFHRRLEEADSLVRQLRGRDPRRAEEFEKAFAAVRVAGEAARAAHDQQEWADVYQNLGSRIWQAGRLLDDTGKVAEPWDPGELRVVLSMELDRVMEAVRSAGRAAGEGDQAMLDRWWQEGDRLAAALDEVDLEDPRAADRLSDLYQRGIRRLRVWVEQWVEGLDKDRDIERPPGSDPPERPRS